MQSFKLTQTREQINFSGEETEKKLLMLLNPGTGTFTQWLLEGQFQDDTSDF